MRTLFIKRPILLASLLFVFLAALSIFSATKVSAATGQWIDAAHIKVGNDIYIDPTVGDSMDYFLGGVDNCTSVIKGFPNDYTDSARSGNNSGFTQAILWVKTRDPRTGCPSGPGNPEPITLTSGNAPGAPHNSRILFHWVDQATLESAYINFSLGTGMASTKGGIFNILSGSTNEFLRKDDNQCKDEVVRQNPSEGNFIVRLDSGGGCNEVNFTKIGLGSPTNSNLAAGTGKPTNASGSIGQTASPSCESEGGDLSWILCPLLRQADNIVEKIDRTINNLLQVPNAYFEGTAGANLRSTWARLRNIAFIILVPIMLIMVISTALGSGLVDAYTVKKALPRLFAAVLFMSLSYDLCIFMIKFFNDIGSGVAGLITSSFGGVDNITLASIFNPNGLTDVVVGPVAVFAGVGALAIAGPGVIGSFALVTVVALLIGFVVLSLRQVILIFLVLFAPLAILAWIFPGNDKLWKLWWGSFSKLLLLYPIVIGLIAFGKVFAKLVDMSLDSQSGSALVAENVGSLPNMFLKLLAYIGPYFFIPATFKLAGGLFATITGAVNDKSRGFFDKQRKKRTETFAKRKDLAGSGTLFNKQKRLGKMGNFVSTWTASPAGNAQYKIGTSKTGKAMGLGGVGASIRSGIHHKNMEQTSKLSQEMQAAGMNDRALAAASGQWGALSENVQTAMTAKFGKQRTLKSRQDFEEAAKILREHGDGRTEGIAANSMAGMADKIGTLGRDPELNYANIGAAAAMEWSRQGFASSKNLAGVGNLLKEEGMHSDLAQGLTTRAQLMGQASRLDLKAGYGVLYDKDTGKFKDGVSETYQVQAKDDKGNKLTNPDGTPKMVTRNRGDDLVKTVKSHEWTSAKSGSVEALADNIKHVATSNDPDTQSMQHVIAQNVNSSADPTARTAWRKIASDVFRDENGNKLDDDALNSKIYGLATGFPTQQPGVVPAHQPLQPPPEPPPPPPIGTT